MKSTLTTLAMFALAFGGADAGFTKYSEMTPTGVVTVDQVSGACPAKYTSGASNIAISYTGFPVGETVDIKLCFTKAKISERPWRKFVDIVAKNKQCWQTAELAKFFKAGAYVTDENGDGTYTAELPVNTAPSEYTIQVLSKDAGGGYSQFQDSKNNNNSCSIKTEIYNNLPTNLVGVQAFFTVFSIVVLVAAYTYDKAKNA